MKLLQRTRHIHVRNVLSPLVEVEANGWSKSAITLKFQQIQAVLTLVFAFELSADTFSELTDSLYESKIVYRSKKYQDRVRTSV